MPEILDLHSRTSKTLRALAEAAMRRHGLHLGQNLLLAELWANDGATPGEIAAAVNVTTPTVVKMATRMSAAGLVVRRHDDRDNRLVRLWLTDKGRALQFPVEAERQRMEDGITTDLSATERRHLIAALNKINRSALALMNDSSDARPD